MCNIFLGFFTSCARCDLSQERLTCPLMSICLSVCLSHFSYGSHNLRNSGIGQVTGENCTVRNFIICTFRQVGQLLRWLIRGGWETWGLEDEKVRTPCTDMGVHGKIILKRFLKNMGVTMRLRVRKLVSVGDAAGFRDATLLPSGARRQVTAAVGTLTNGCLFFSFHGFSLLFSCR